MRIAFKPTSRIGINGDRTLQFSYEVICVVPLSYLTSITRELDFVIGILGFCGNRGSKLLRHSDVGTAEVSIEECPLTYYTRGQGS